MKTLLSRVEKERDNYVSAEHAAIDHLKMAHAHLFEKMEGRDIHGWLSDIEKIILKIEHEMNTPEYIHDLGKMTDEQEKEFVERLGEELSKPENQKIINEMIEKINNKESFKS